MRARQEVLVASNGREIHRRQICQMGLRAKLKEAISEGTPHTETLPIRQEIMSNRLALKGLNRRQGQLNWLTGRNN